VNALANPDVGAFLNQHFVSSFQKVATFQIVNGQKQGGNVASYFCAPDGRVLHCVAGPVDAATMLREAKWVVDSVKKAMEENRKTEVPFKALFRRRHAERLRQEFGLVVEPATFDAPTSREDDPLTYNDPTGRPVLPVLVLPPIDGPDVQFRAMAKEAAADAAPGANIVACRKGGRWSLGNQGRVHQLMSAYSMTKIEKVYATVFESILGERVSTKPVITINARDNERRVICLTCESKAHAQD
jgi:hypothetical protein